ncbi:MAG TPA: pyroglutamyl peptidase [Actinophytocola sp.]|uniref:pyroglutamyl peptidase n=1 Tax=Actinophytocola sp. TaxID=1872138 RepID=UPI002DBFAF90|nr:pyroglutamyl peptidase [Actinophytocola sp.]HEU5472451.1 pyroglutamyl peptidase [Actinophytocola sp.]
MRSIRALLIAVPTALTCLVAAPAVATATTPDCFDPAAPLTVEEQRLALPVPQEILRLTGFDRFAQVFGAALCAVPNRHLAGTAVAVQGKVLWTAAVERAQGRLPAIGLDRTDDRPLYWARLTLSRALRQWTPAFGLPAADRDRLLETLERTSRGQDTVQFPAGRGINRILVSGFDPFQLDLDIRRSNPSGAAALALDGTVLSTSAGPARIETAMFPVNWDPFAAGVVEQTFQPFLEPGRRQVDMFTTVSQGRPERFDVERYNGRWRGGFPDNLNVSRTGVIPIPPAVPTVLPAPEFVPTTLPFATIVAAPTGRFPVFDNTAVVEIPAGATAPVTSPTGPTPGSVARQGGGGNFLSNEISYRTTLLRDALHTTTPGGHLHTPVLRFAEGNTTEITDPTFIQNRTDIINQVRTILTVAAATLD